MGLVELKNCRYRIFNDYDEHCRELERDNFDIIYHYLTNREEIKEKLSLNNCSIIDDDNKYVLSKNINQVIFLFNNFDKVFNYEKVLIK